MIQIFENLFTCALTYIDETQTSEMEGKAHNSLDNKKKFAENMANVLFLSPVYQNITDVDIVSTFILLVCMR